jgi:hypothetical protein
VTKNLRLDQGARSFVAISVLFGLNLRLRCCPFPHPIRILRISQILSEKCSSFSHRRGSAGLAVVPFRRLRQASRGGKRENGTT